MPASPEPAADSAGLCGEFRIFDDTGRLLATASGVVMMPVLREAAPTAPDDWFYSLDWPERPLAISSATHSLGGILAASRSRNWAGRSRISQRATDWHITRRY